MSRTPFDEFDGTTDRIDGYALLTSSTSSAGRQYVDSKLYFEVDLASIETGIGLRNRHMRDNYLEVEAYPFATFDGTIVSVDTINEMSYTVSGNGTMSVHGVDRDMEIVCDVSPENNGYRSRCSFQLLLSDFDIKIPKLMFLKLANEIRLELDFALIPQGGG